MSQNRSRRETVLRVRLDTQESEDLKARANSAGLDVSKFVRLAIRGSRIVNQQEWRRFTSVVLEMNTLLIRILEEQSSDEPVVDAFNRAVVLLQIERTLRKVLNGGGITP